ncbi:PREDICTED: ankyrin repeat and zinc finger domain-containing protein 1-like [Priapulus caudatus]|uniref:Ankyrin repeat and zinc finger domain-containing protein 1-like n=1 Tax=Priapulus caudatus TaxID=37621 RepID=A0ABM1E4A3_PRICU|nr:PREDICTED: ankyrin repeat and zinc finger domain-containing protein 1-like [Priapulus caudatus]
MDKASSKQYKVYKLYDKQHEPVLEGLRVVELGTTEKHCLEYGEEGKFHQNTRLEFSVSEKMACTACCISFTDRKDQVHHYKLDWHRYNLKQKMHNFPTVSEEIFEDITGDVSSISGSDTDDSESESPGEGDGSSSKYLADNLFGCDSKSMDTNEKGSINNEEQSMPLTQAIMNRTPKIFLRNKSDQLLAVYRCITHSKKDTPSNDDLANIIANIPDHMNWAIIMAGGGHFAAGIFDKDEIMVHKTFHRYTVRAKRGTSQGTYDGAHGKARSAGASLRRYNEAALALEVKELLTSWSDRITKCDRIFLQAPRYNRGMFLHGKDAPINKNDPRISTIPFPTRRPTLSEIKRVHSYLSTIECFGEGADIRSHLPVSPRKLLGNKKRHNLWVKPETHDVSDSAILSGQKGGNKANQSSDHPEIPEDLGILSGSDDGEMDMLVIEESIDTLGLQEMVCKPKRRRRRNKPKKQSVTSSAGQQQADTCILNEEHHQLKNGLYTACKTGNVEVMNQLLNQLSQPSPAAHSPEQTAFAEILNGAFGELNSTLLHVAAKEGHVHVVNQLLEVGSNPCIRDKKDRTPFLNSKDKATRNEFRRFMGKYPDRYDYREAQIPSSLTEEMERERAAKEKERKRFAQKAKKERQKELKVEEARIAAECKEKKRFLELSDREKRALAAERRMVQHLQEQGSCIPVLARCFQCGTDMTGQTPFEYMDFKFCSTTCLREHRKHGEIGR